MKNFWLLTIVPFALHADLDVFENEFDLEQANVYHFSESHSTMRIPGDWGVILESSAREQLWTLCGIALAFDIAENYLPPPAILDREILATHAIFKLGDQDVQLRSYQNGFVSLDERSAASPEELLQALQLNDKDTARWVVEPFLNETNHSLVWMVEKTDDEEGNHAEIVVLQFGRQGIAKFDLSWPYAQPEVAFAAEQFANRVHSFDSGYRYEDRRWEDPVSSFGVADLIANHY